MYVCIYTLDRDLNPSGSWVADRFSLYLCMYYTYMYLPTGSGKISSRRLTFLRVGQSFRRPVNIAKVGPGLYPHSSPVIRYLLIHVHSRWNVENLPSCSLQSESTLVCIFRQYYIRSIWTDLMIIKILPITKDNLKL